MDVDVQFTEEVIQIANKAAAKYPADIQKAADSAERGIRALDSFDEIMAMLFRRAVVRLVYESRHRTNTRIKNETGQRCSRAKTVCGKSEGVRRAAESCYGHRIAGTIIGLVQGKELSAIAASEAAVGNGHLFNAELARKLETIVPAEKLVRDAISEKRLRSIMEGLREKYRDGDSRIESETGSAIPMPLGDRTRATDQGRAKRPKQVSAARSTRQAGK